MAEYLPLLERAVAGLADATPDSRRAIYERARSALLGQLRTMDPPVAKADIDRESAALDEAIAQIEAKMQPLESAPAAAPTGSRTPPRPVTPRPPRFTASPLPVRPSSSSPPAAAPNPGAPLPEAASSALAPAAPAAGSPGVPVPPRDRTLPAPRPGQRPAAPLRAPPEAAGAVPAPPVSSTRSARPLNTAPRIGIEPRGPAPLREPASLAGEPVSVPSVETPPPIGADLPTPSRTGVRTAEIEPRPTGPAEGWRTIESEEARRPRGPLFYLTSTLILVLVGGVAYEAWKHRDRPEQIIVAPQGAAADPSGKVADRAAEPSTTGLSHATPVPAAVPVPASGAVSAVTPAPAPSPTSEATDVPVSVGSGAASPSAAGQPPIDAATATPAPATEPARATDAGVAAPPPASQPAEQTASPTLGVSQRAALLIDAPQDPQKVKTYVGSVVWKDQSVNPGQGQPLSEAIVADVDIPDAKVTMSMVMKRNTEPQFPASHTIEIRFTSRSGNDVGAIRQINVPEMRLDDGTPTGEPLRGLPVAITDNYFLVGLSRGADEAGNIQMLQNRNWVDVTLLLASGKIAKITFEKGTPGQRVVADAIRAWQSGG